MNKSAIQYLRRVLENAKGDDLERAQAAFRGISEVALDQQYGQSGKTCREVLAEYEQERWLWKEASDLLEKYIEDAR